MVYFDVIMPIALFAVTVVAMLLDRRIEGKLKTNLENREFRSRDAVLLVAMITAAVSIVIFVPQMAILAVFLFSYSTLLFTFSYLFSNMRKKRAQLFSTGFGVASIAAGTFALLEPNGDSVMFYGAVGLYVLAAFAFSALLLERKRTDAKYRWYLGALPPVLFVLLYVVYNGTGLWFPYLLDAYGLTFAVLIILYLASLFTWKTAFIFAGLLTVMDIVLVLITGVMVTAVKQVSGLGLPVLVSLPTIPLIFGSQGGILYMSLGLGDFFFAGTLATQTFKKFGLRIAVFSALTMSVSFGVFEALLLNYRFEAFPGTVMIICGWVPVVAWKILKERNVKNNVLKS